MDRLSKVAHFIPIKTTFSRAKLAELYISRIVCLHGLPKGIVSDRGAQFTSHFWKCLREAMGTQLSFSTAYHPQTGGQTKRVNQILEDMLRACVLSNGKKWEKCLTFVEFSYNNSYQASFQMSPFEVLYGRRCRTPLNWSNSGERQLFGPDLINEAEEQVQLIRDRLRATQSRQKCYADRRQHELSFEVNDYVYLKVTPMKGVHRFHLKGKLAPCYIRPFRIPAKRGVVAYQLELPPSLSEVHIVFHVSQLKKCLRVPTEATELEALGELTKPVGEDSRWPERAGDESWRRRKVVLVDVDLRKGRAPVSGRRLKRAVRGCLRQKESSSSSSEKERWRRKRIQPDLKKTVDAQLHG